MTSYKTTPGPTKAQAKADLRIKRVREVSAGGLEALKSLPDFQTITEVVSRVIEAEFAGQGRDTPTGKGIRSVRFANFEYSNTIYIPGEAKFTTGWRARIYFTLDSKLSPIPVIRAFERFGVRAMTGAHQSPGVDLYDLSHRIDVYILSDDFATMAVRRRFAGLDERPGPANTRFPKNA